MKEFDKVQAETLKSAIQEKFIQFYTGVNDALKAHDFAEVSDLKLVFSEEDKETAGSNKLSDWTMEIRLTSEKISNSSFELTLEETSKEVPISCTKKKSKEIPERLGNCSVVSLNPLVIDCS